MGLVLYSHFRVCENTPVVINGILHILVSDTINACNFHARGVFFIAHITVIHSIIRMLQAEKPGRILEISDEGILYGQLLQNLQKHNGIQNGYIDRIAFTTENTLKNTVYRRVFSAPLLETPKWIEDYDYILILGLFEKKSPIWAREFLETLQYKVTKQIQVFTPLQSTEGHRPYHPVVFLGLDFCCTVLDSENTIQCISVFPKQSYAPMCIDHIPEAAQIPKLRVAFALPHLNLTGGMKALLQQIRYLTKRGHSVTVYARCMPEQSAIPVWSDLTPQDYAAQIPVPPEQNFADAIVDADILLLGWMYQIPEFSSCKIPLVLWEQGSEMLYGDFGFALDSRSRNRLDLHVLYRMPVHLLCVSQTNADALKGIYNRDAFLFPNGTDTTLYHPAQKKNDLPTVLLVGNPMLPFKGFVFALRVLERTYTEGLQFRVKWACQVPPQIKSPSFPLQVQILPSQAELAVLYREADIFLSASLYESYPLPPLEAMASGTPVVATDCGGIRTYAIHDDNCILCGQGDEAEMANALVSLLQNPKKQAQLAKAGRKTALAHSADETVKLLEKRLAAIAQWHQNND